MRFALALLAVAAATPALAAPPESGTKDCVVLSRVTDQRIVDEHTIYMREAGHWYRNDITPACPGLKPRNAFSTRTTTTNLCRGDIITVFDAAAHFEYGSCGLGSFTAVDGPPAKVKH